jgi:hypothetical protein
MPWVKSLGPLELCSVDILNKSHCAIAGVTATLSRSVSYHIPLLHAGKRPTSQETWQILKLSYYHCPPGQMISRTRLTWPPEAQKLLVMFFLRLFKLMPRDSAARTTGLGTTRDSSCDTFLFADDDLLVLMMALI